jgi:hypothetical protein
VCGHYVGKFPLKTAYSGTKQRQMQCYGLPVIAPLASSNPDAEHALADESSRANQPARARDEFHALLDLEWQFLPGTQATAIPT